MRAHLRKRAHVPGRRVLDDLLLDRRPDPREARRRLLERELGDRDGRLADPLRRPPVGLEAEGVGAVELEQVGEEVEALGELGVQR